MLLTRLDWDDFNSKLEAFRPSRFTKEGRILIWDYLVDLDERAENLGIPNQIINIPKVCCEFRENTLEEFARQNDIPVTNNEAEIYRSILNYLTQEDRLIGFCEPSGNVVYLRAGKTNLEYQPSDMS